MKFLTSIVIATAIFTNESECILFDLLGLGHGNIGGGGLIFGGSHKLGGGMR